jgi:hypothetical protein
MVDEFMICLSVWVVPVGALDCQEFSFGMKVVEGSGGRTGGVEKWVAGEMTGYLANTTLASLHGMDDVQILRIRGVPELTTGDDA